MSLRALGLTAAEEEAYQLLITAGSTELPELTRLSRQSRQQLATTISRLQDKGLVTQVGESPQRLVATPPDVALAPLLLQGQESLSAAGRLVTELSEQHRAQARRRDATQLVEVVTGAAGIRQALRTMQLSTREEMLWFCRAGHVAMPSSDNDEEFAMLARGVRYQVLYEQELLEEPGMLQSLQEGVLAGEEARAVARLPIRMAIADRSIALCPLVASGDGRSEPTAALVRDSNLLTALIALFERYWSAASPLVVAAATAPSAPELPGQDGAGLTDGAVHAVGPEELELLSLLVAGVTDKAVATRLRVSTRTVQRRVSELMELTGAQSRMQLAWQVAQRGWLSGTVHAQRDRNA